MVLEAWIEEVPLWVEMEETWTCFLDNSEVEVEVTGEVEAEVSIEEDLKVVQEVPDLVEKAHRVPQDFSEKALEEVAMEIWEANIEVEDEAFIEVVVEEDTEVEMDPLLSEVAMVVTLEAEIEVNLLLGV